MMSRPPRVEFGGAVHHVVARGDRREEIFRDDRDRGKFLGYLAEGAERYRVKVHCYVMMENHFHLKERGIRNNLGRRCAITLCWDHAGLSHDDNLLTIGPIPPAR